MADLDGPGLVLGAGLLALTALVGGAALAGARQGAVKVNALGEDDYDTAMAHVAKMEEAVRHGADVRTLRNHKGLTFQEWARAAGWSEAAKKLTGMGFEAAEISWQTGEDPPEVRAGLQKDAWELATFLNRPELERELAEETRRLEAERRQVGADVNRAILPGLAPPTKEAQLAVLMSELEQLTGRRGPKINATFGPGRALGPQEGFVYPPLPQSHDSRLLEYKWRELEAKADVERKKVAKFRKYGGARPGDIYEPDLKQAEERLAATEAEIEEVLAAHEAATERARKEREELQRAYPPSGKPPRVR